MPITTTPTKTQLWKVSATSGGTYAIWKGLQTMDSSSDSEVQEDRVFGEADPIVSRDTNATTWDFDGLRDLTDATGQGVVKAAFASGATIYFQDLPDGTTGFMYPVIVVSWNEGSSRDNRARTFSGSLRQNGAAVAVPAA